MKNTNKNRNEFWKNNKTFREIIILLVSSTFIYIVVVLFDGLYYLQEYLNKIDSRGESKFIFAITIINIALLIFAVRRWREFKNEVIERKIAEMRRQRDRAQLQAVLDGVPDMILQVDNNARILWANKEALIKNTNAIGKTFDYAFSIIDEPFIDYYCRLAMETSKIEKGIKFLPSMYGIIGESYWEGIGVPLKGNDGNVFGAIAIARDVSERMRLEHTWNLLASVVESTVDAVYGMAFGGTVLTWNPGAEKIYGYASHEIVGKSIAMLIPLENRNEIMAIIDKVIRKQQIERFESIRIRKDGKQIYVSISICPFVDATGKKIGVSSIDRDITESKIAEDTLKNSEEKFRTLVTPAPDGIVLTDVNGNIIEINKAMSYLFEYNREDMLSEAFAKFFPVNGNLNIPSNLQHILQLYESSSRNETFAIKKSGNIVPVEISIAGLKNEMSQTTGMIAIVRDISIRKSYEDELKNSREQLRGLASHLQTAREDEKKRIAFEIHDELGYALTALKLDLAWLAKKAKIKEDVLTKKIKEMTELIETTIKKVRTISTQLRPSILDHFGLIAAIEWQASEFQKRTAIRCKVVFEPKDIFLDDPRATAVFRIFQETLTNITRHAKATRVDVSLSKTGGEIELKVVDNGVGIDAGQLNNFKSLGLLGIQERADFLGGVVEIKGEKGLGTSVTLRIPAPQKEIIND